MALDIPAIVFNTADIFSSNNFGYSIVLNMPVLGTD